MEILLGIVIAIVAVLAVSFLRSITTLFHELGHAIPALLFTEQNQPVIVYIGSYGDISHARKFGIGRMVIFFQFNLFAWNTGLCQYSRQKDSWKEAIIILGGPIASLIISIPLIFWIVNNDLGQGVELFLSAFIAAAILDFIANMFPSSNPIHLHDGGVAYCDGFALLALLFSAFSSKEVKEMEHLFKEKKYRKVQEIGEGLLTQTKVPRAVFDWSIAASKELSEYRDALWFYEKLNEKHKLDSLDYYEIAMLYLELSNKEEALKCLNVCINMKKESPGALYERGVLRKKKYLYKEAIRDFDLAIYYVPDMGAAFYQKGLCLQNLGEIATANSCFQKAEELGYNQRDFY